MLSKQVPAINAFGNVFTNCLVALYNLYKNIGWDINRISLFNS